jgi:hypothetical protein
VRIDFIKKNWEKVLLGAVLVGLLVAVVGLPIKIAREKTALEAVRTSITERPVSEIEDVDLGPVAVVLERTEQPADVNLSTSNRVFNPMTWKRSQSGTLLRVNTGKEIGAQAVRVDSITPLYLVVTLDSVLSSDSGFRYAIGVERQAAQSRSARVKRQSYAAVGEKNNYFRLLRVNGPDGNPTSVELELGDTGQLITVTNGEPFKREDGYLADLSYPPDSRTWTGRRVGDWIPVEREYYNIVAITKSEVVLSARSGKKTSLKVNPESPDAVRGTGP